MTKRFGVWTAVVAACLAVMAGGAAAQEGTGAPVFRLRGDEIRTAYPAAKAKGLEGEALVTCQTFGGVLWACDLTSETPVGEGFGPAALALVKRYEASGPPNDAFLSPRPQPIRVPFRLPEEKTFHVAGVEYAPPRTLETPSLDALYDAWPRAERFSGVEGRASLWCTVTVEGRTDACTVGQESRPGQGFGAAALKVAPLYRFAPARRNGVPVAMSIPLQVDFFCDARCRRFEGGRRAPGDWVSVPTPAEVRAAYPAAARARGLAGQARLDCLPTNGGALTDCRVAVEAPAGQGFGAAALKLADRFRAAQTDYPERLSFSVAFDDRPGLVDWIWATPPETASKPRVDGAPVVNGRSRLRCQVVQGGRVEGCIVLESTPPDPEVARRVLEKVGGLIVRNWTQEGRSTIGSSVELTLSTAFSNADLVVAPPVPPTVRPGVLDYRPALAPRPAAEDMSRYFPDRAQRMEVNGRAVLTCVGVKDRRPDNCQVVSESPLEYGFGDAALKMSRLFRYTPQTIDGVPSDDPITIPFEFSVPR